MPAVCDDVAARTRTPSYRRTADEPVDLAFSRNGTRAVGAFAQLRGVSFVRPAVSRAKAPRSLGSLATLAAPLCPANIAQRIDLAARRNRLAAVGSLAAVVGAERLREGNQELALRLLGEAPFIHETERESPLNRVKCQRELALLKDPSSIVEDTQPERISGGLMKRSARYWLVQRITSLRKTSSAITCALRTRLVPHVDFRVR